MKPRKARVAWWAAALAIFAWLPNIALSDPPARVGRVSDLSGTVYVAGQDTQNSWKEVGLNYPLTTGDSVYVEKGGRIEIDFGGGFLRFAGDTNVHLSALEDQRVELYVAQGQAIVRLRYLDSGDSATIQTPNAHIVLERAGSYRVDVRDDLPTTTFAVREGEATLDLAGAMEFLAPGRMITVSGVDSPRISITHSSGYDGFEAWSQARDQRYESARSSYVSRDMVGWRDLEDHGYWETSPTYGAVWYPTTVAVGWAPYRHGRWVWVSPWGWTWIDDARWGFAPFHYGRWVWFGSRWGWCPGPYVVRPIYAPALVAFYDGPAWSFSVSSGPVYSWVPLGWGEPYYPLYRFSNNYWRRVNKPYVTNLAERPVKPPATYVNVNVPNAVTAVPGAVFTGAKPVGSNVVSVPSGALLNIPAITSPTAFAMKPTPGGMIIREVGRIPAPAATTVRPQAVGRAAPVTELPRARNPAPVVEQAIPHAGGGSLPRPIVPSASPPSVNMAPAGAAPAKPGLIPTEPTSARPSAPPGRPTALAPALSAPVLSAPPAAPRPVLSAPREARMLPPSHVAPPASAGPVHPQVKPYRVGPSESPMAAPPARPHTMPAPVEHAPREGRGAARAMGVQEAPPVPRMESRPVEKRHEGLPFGRGVAKSRAN